MSQSGSSLQIVRTPTIEGKLGKLQCFQRLVEGKLRASCPFLRASCNVFKGLARASCPTCPARDPCCPQQTRVESHVAQLALFIGTSTSRLVGLTSSFASLRSPFHKIWHGLEPVLWPFPTILVSIVVSIVGSYVVWSVGSLRSSLHSVDARTEGWVDSCVDRRRFYNFHADF
jgi:hypothetical protein